MSVLVDTNVFVDQLRMVPAARALLERLGASEPVRASILTRSEIRSGSLGTSVEVELLLSRVAWEGVSEEIADRAGAFARRYRPTYPGIGPIDYLIAATADVLGLELITRNVRHFPMFSDLRAPYRR